MNKADGGDAYMCVGACACVGTHDMEKSSIPDQGGFDKGSCHQVQRVTRSVQARCYIFSVSISVSVDVFVFVLFLRFLVFLFFFSIPFFLFCCLFYSNSILFDSMARWAW